MTRYKDGRTLTAFRLSDDERKKLDELAAMDRASKADVVRNLINRSWKARVRIIGHTRPGGG